MDHLDNLSEDLLSINLSADNIDRINQFYLKRLEILCGLMATETRLCDEVSEGIVAEFGFKGDKNEVHSQLLGEFNKRKQTPYTFDDKPELIERSVRFSLYLKRREDNPIKKKIRDIFFEKWGSGDASPAEVLVDALNSQYFENRDAMHSKRECICFNNKWPNFWQTLIKLLYNIMSFSIMEQHIILYAQRRYVHDQEVMDLQNLVASFIDGFSPALLGHNPKEMYNIVLKVWTRAVPQETQVQFWENLFKVEKFVSMAGTIEKMIAQIGKMDFLDLPDPNPDVLRVQK